MRNLGVWIEIGGLQTYVGRIIGEKKKMLDSHMQKSIYLVT